MRLFIPFLLLFSAAAFAENIPSPRFVRNDGQWEKEILYRAAIPGGFISLKKNSLHYVFYHTGDVARQHKHDSHASTPASRQATSVDVGKDRIRAHGFEIAFLNASAQPQLVANDQKPDLRNYYLGDDPSHWAGNVPAFSEIIYKDLYPGIDLRLFAQNGTFKYEFLVAAQANPDVIRMKYTGMSRLSLENGFLFTETSVNKVTETPPYTYQLNKNGIKTEVPSGFALQNDIISFSFPKGFDRKSPMVIDPILVFSTYSGSFTDNWGFTATYDEAGHLYSGGIEFGNRFPATTGAFQTTFGGNVDVAVLKYTPDGKSLIYATYVGGNAADIPHSMIVDANNNLVIMGTTSSRNFPVTANAYDRTFNGGNRITPVSIDYADGSDLFVAKLNASASTLLGSTYLGGSQNDGLNYETLEIFNYGDELRGEVNLDAQGNIYLASTTVSNNFPLVNASQTRFQGFQEAVICQFDPTLSQLVWSTYLGGSGFDAVRGIRIAPSGTVYVTGGTTSSNLPASQGVIKSTFSGREDGFVASFQNRQLTRLSYLGTSSSDQSYLIDIDPDENVYVFGLTYGSYPVSRGVYANANSGQFIHAMDKTFSQTLFSTVIGSGRRQPDISPTAFMRNTCGFIYLSGWGGQVNLPNPEIPGSNGIAGSSTTGFSVTPNALKTSTTGDDYYLAILDVNASQLLFGTFFGSPEGTNHVDGGTSRFSPDGTIYHAACACRDNSTFPTTPGVWSNRNNGTRDDADNAPNTGCNNAAFKINLDGLEANFEFTSDSCGLPAQVRLTNRSEGGKQYEWLVNGQVKSTAANQTQLSLDQPGEYTITLKAYDPLTCKKVDSVSRKIVVSGTVFKINKDSTICPGQSIRLSASGGTTYQWSPAAGMDNPKAAAPIVKPSQTTTYTVLITDAFGCSKSLSTTVTVNDFEPDFEILTQSECGGPTRLRLVNKTDGTRAEWQVVDKDSSGIVQVDDAWIVGKEGKETQYEIILRAFRGNCSETISKTITIDDARKPVNVLTPNEPNTRFETFRKGWKVEIYDQWGRPVYENESYQNDWTAADAKNTVYYYKLTAPDGASCKGWLQVLR
jgi:hypothetical protein